MTWIKLFRCIWCRKELWQTPELFRGLCHNCSKDCKMPKDKS